MAQLWPDPVKIIGKPAATPTKSTSAVPPPNLTAPAKGGSLWPDPVAVIGKPSATPTAASIPGVAPENPPAPAAPLSPFNPKNPANAEFNKQLDQRAPSTSLFKNFLTSIPGAAKEVGSLAVGTKSLPAQFVRQYTQPSDMTKQAESVVPNVPVIKQTGQAILRTIIPIAEGFGVNVGDQIINQREQAKALANDKTVQTLAVPNAADVEVKNSLAQKLTALKAELDSTKPLPTAPKKAFDAYNAKVNEYNNGLKTYQDLKIRTTRQVQSNVPDTLVTHKISPSEAVDVALNSVNVGLLIAPLITKPLAAGTLRLSDAISKNSKVPISYTDLQKITSATSDAEAISRVGAEKYNAYKEATATNAVRQSLKQGYIELAQKEPNTFATILRNAATKPLSEILNIAKPPAEKFGGVKVPNAPMLPEKAGQEPAVTWAKPEDIIGQPESAPATAHKEFANNYLATNSEKVVTDYTKIIQNKYGSSNVVSADHAKEAIPGYNGTNSDEYQPAASKFATAYYDKLLQEQKGKANNTVLIFAGGTGAGKTSALKSLGEATSQYSIVYDTNSTTVKAASDKIDKALANGYQVRVMYVVRDPALAYEQGVIPRMGEERRVVTIDSHAQMHGEVYNTIPELQKKYGDKIQLDVVDNTGEPGQAKIVSVDKMPKIDHANNIKERLYGQLQEARQQNRITEQQFRKAAGTLGPTVRGQSEQERLSGRGTQSQSRQKGLTNPKKVKPTELPTPKKRATLVAPKATVKTSIKPDWAKSDDLTPGIIEQLKNAEPGKRVGLNYGKDAETIAWKSTFPDWIPSDLRLSSIIKPVAEHLANGTLPTSKKQIELYNYIAEMIGAEDLARQEGIAEANREAIGEEDINKLISEAQAEETALQQKFEDSHDQRPILQTRKGESQSQKTQGNQSGARKQKQVIRHYTLPENVSKILSEGFDTSKPPIHGVGGLEAGAKSEKFGKDTLYFTLDNSRWNTAEIYVGEGKGNISRKAYDYAKQGWIEEKNAYKKVDLKPVEATLTDNAKVLTIDNLQKGLDIIRKHGRFDKYSFIEDLLSAARAEGYDVVNIQSGNWKSAELGTNKFGQEDWYKTLTGNSGNNDFFVLNKNAIELVKPEATAKAPSLRQPTKNSGIEGFNPKNLEDLEKPVATKETDKIIKRSEIAKELSDKLGVPIRRGKFNRAGALGVFKPEPKVVRIKKGGLPVVFHEVAHFLDDKFNFSSILDKTEREALMEEYAIKYEDNVKKQQHEGFAEFVRFKMTGQEARANTMAPKFAKAFEARLNELPEIKDVLDTAAADYKRWQEQPAVAKVLSHISLGEENSASLSDRISNNLHNFYTMALDDLHPLAEFSALGKKFGTVAPENDPYILARNTRGWIGKANTFLEKGTFGKNYWENKDGKIVAKFTGKSFTAIMKPIEKAGKLDEFRVYLVAQRAVELAGREKPILTGITLADAKSALEELGKKNPEFEEAAQDLYKYQDALLNYGAENGLIGPKGLEKIKALNKFRVPFYRVMETVRSNFMGGKKIAGNLSSPIKKIKGSEREIVDPIESIIKDTYAIINAAERNNIGIAMANLSKTNFELGRLFEQTDKPMKPVTVSAREVLTKIADTVGLDMSISEEIGDMAITLFRPTMDAGPNMLNVNFGDKTKVFQVDPDLFKAIQGLNVEDAGIIVRILSMPARLLRAGATLSPDFAVRNPIRDQFSAMVYSKFGYKPGFDLIRGIFQVFKKGDVYDLWRMAGGEHSMMVSLDREYLQSNFKELVRSKGGTLFHYIKHPIDALRVLSEIGEQATRLGEMRRGLVSGASPIESAFASREVTLDFARIGAKTKAVNSIVAFWNANVQGLDKMVRAFKEKPFRTTFRVFMGITLPSILLYFANRKDPRWKEIPQWQKDLFWIVMTKNHIYRIPKPFELGILFGSVPERILEFLDTHDKNLFPELESSVANGATPGFIPTALVPVIENITNYSFFLDRPIVSQGQEALPPEAQSGTYTTEIAKLIGEKLGYSPSKIDNLIQGYSGGLGKYATAGVDKVLTGTGISNPPTAPTMRFEDTPILKAFMIRPPVGTASESVNRVYNANTKAAAELAYVKKLFNEGEKEKAATFIKENPDIANAALLSSVVASFSQINKARDQIRQSRLLNPKVKQEKIAKLDEIQTHIAQEILKQIK